MSTPLGAIIKRDLASKKIDWSLTNLYYTLRETGDIYKLRRPPLLEAYRLSKVSHFTNAYPEEYMVPHIEETDAYDKKPLVPPNARELFDNGTISDFSLILPFSLVCCEFEF